MRMVYLGAFVLVALLTGCQRSQTPGAMVPPGPSVTIELSSPSVSRAGNEIVCVVKYRVTGGQPKPTDVYRVEWREPKEGFAILAKVEGKDLQAEGEFKGRFQPHKPFGPES